MEHSLFNQGKLADVEMFDRLDEDRRVEAGELRTALGERAANQLYARLSHHGGGCQAFLESLEGFGGEIQRDQPSKQRICYQPREEGAGPATKIQYASGIGAS